jgi:hypothetical protein
LYKKTDNRGLGTKREDFFMKMMLINKTKTAVRTFDKQLNNQIIER